MTTSTIEDRNALVLNNIPLADKIAKSKKRKLSHVSLDELKSAAYLGLVEAAQNYDENDNDCFPAYAVWRIIGAVRDYLRELSWGSRSEPRKVAEIHLYEEELCVETQDASEFFEDLTKHLPAVSKKVMQLYYIDGLKISEIATEMSVHQSRISQILSDSRNRLQLRWREQETELWAAVA